MSTLNDLGAGLQQAWRHLAEGWQHLRERAGRALTRFHPTDHDGAVETRAARLERQAPRWGLLPAEVEETADQLVVRLEVPGMDRDHLEVSVVDDHLVVRGERHMSRRASEGRFHLMEVAYGAFERVLPLPVAVDPDHARARYRDGVLTVTLRKRDGTTVRRIPVKPA